MSLTWYNKSIRDKIFFSLQVLVLLIFENKPCAVSNDYHYSSVPQSLMITITLACKGISTIALLSMHLNPTLIHCPQRCRVLFFTWSGYNQISTLLKYCNIFLVIAYRINLKILNMASKACCFEPCWLL